MSQQQSFNPDSLVVTYAIPRIPFSFQKPLQEDKAYTTSCSWEHMLSYNNPLYEYAPSGKKIFVEEKTAYFNSPLTPLPFQNVYAYKDSDFLLAVVLLLITIYAALTAIFSRYLKQFYYASFIYSESQRLYNDQNAVIPSLFFWLNTIALIIFSLFIFLVFKHHGIYASLGSIPLFFVAMAYVTIFLIFRAIIIKFTGWLLGRRDVFREYLFHSLLYYKIGSLLILPILVVAIFSDVRWTGYGLTVSAALLLLLHGFIYMRGTKIILKKGILIFYWILYLCTAEFVPFLMLYKYISTRVQGG